MRTRPSVSAMEEGPRQHPLLNEKSKNMSPITPGKVASSVRSRFFIKRVA